MTPLEPFFTMPLQYLAYSLGLGFYAAYAILFVVYFMVLPSAAILVWVWANEPEEAD